MEITEGEGGMENREITGHEEIDEEDLSGEKEGYDGAGKIGINGNQVFCKRKMHEDQEKKRHKMKKEGVKKTIPTRKWVRATKK